MYHRLQSIYWKKGKIVIIDQTKLPVSLEYKILNNVDEVTEAIVNMRVRGAPLIGVTAALGLAQIAYQYKDLSRDILISKLEEGAEKLRKTRPTAINLFYGINRIMKAAYNSHEPAEDVVSEALKMLEEDIRINQKIAEVGQEIIDNEDVILTHCNTGSLATVSIGTALGIITYAHEIGKKITVYATETRPKLQGARLTMFELLHAGIKSYLIPDTAVAHTMKTKNIKKVIVGADRILRNGTVYNKIGTYQIAILAREMGVKFYSAAPTSTFDLETISENVTIEERSKEEVIYFDKCQVAPSNSNVFNPAFDETPPGYIDGIVTEYEILKKPFEENIEKLFKTVSRS